MAGRRPVNHAGGHGDGPPDHGPGPARSPAAPASSLTPETVASFRSQLTTGEDAVDPGTWAGSVPVAHGIAPRVRIGRRRWFNLLWLLPIGFALLIVAVRDPGLPIWVGVQHFFNLFLLIFIIRSGLQILGDRPRLYWTRHSTPGRDWSRIQKPVPADPLWTAKQDSISLPGQVGLPGIRHSTGLARWWHLGVNTLWLLNGALFYVLVFTTGLLRNLNHIYAGRDATDWVGFALFAASMAVVIAGWAATTPFTLRHPRVVQRAGFALIGPAQRLFEHLDATPGQYREKDISPYFWHNGKYPDSPRYTALFDGHFADYRLRINGLVRPPVELTLAELRALPYHEQITQHFCIQRWSGIAKLGFKQVKWIKGIEFVEHFSQLGGGYGGYNEDHEFFGYRQTI